jgi:hypothetical protein
MEKYADIVKLHYEYFKDREKYKKYSKKGINILDKYTDNNSMVVEDGDEIIVAMRGLQPLSSTKDIIIGTEIFFEDAYQQSGFDFESATKKKKGISILPNFYGEILLEEQKKIDDLKKEFPNKNIVLTGHSRGGRKAIDLGEKNNLEYHSYQPAEMNTMGQSALGLATNVLVPTGLAGNIDFEKKLLSSAIGSKTFKSTTEKFLGKEPEKRKGLTEGISNIYRTSNDVVSKGYEATDIVPPKQYAYGFFDHYMLGDHSIDHFISREMFDAIDQNKSIEEDIIETDTTFSPEQISQPSSSIGYTVDNRELCKKYGSVYDVHCNKIFR